MPSSRKEFERNMFFLSEGFEKDLIVISKENIKSIKGIVNVRYAPNNRANLNTVNEMARLMANTVAKLSISKETKFED